MKFCRFSFDDIGMMCSFSVLRLDKAGLIFFMMMFYYCLYRLDSFCYGYSSFLLDGDFFCCLLMKKLKRLMLCFFFCYGKILKYDFNFDLLYDVGL